MQKLQIFWKKLFVERGNLMKTENYAENTKFGLNSLSKLSCHGNMKPYDLKIDTPKCSEIIFRKIHKVWP